MGDVVNLRTARKAKARDAAAQAAQANRATFGRTRAEKARDALNAQRLAKVIEGAKLDD